MFVQEPTRKPHSRNTKYSAQAAATRATTSQLINAANATSTSFRFYPYFGSHKFATVIGSSRDAKARNCSLKWAANCDAKIEFKPRVNVSLSAPSRPVLREQKAALSTATKEGTCQYMVRKVYIVKLEYCSRISHVRRSDNEILYILLKYCFQAPAMNCRVQLKYKKYFLLDLFSSF